MHDLHDLLSAEADGQVPTTNRPFVELVQARRRRDLGKRLGAIAGAGGAALAVAAVVSSVHGNARPEADGQASPGPSAVAPCSIGKLAFTFRWLERRSDGALSGELTAKNITDRSCRLSDRPRFNPLDTDGLPLTIQLAFGPGPGPQRTLRPNYSSTASITWYSWCGSQVPSGNAQVWADPSPVLRPSGVTVSLGGLPGEDGVMAPVPHCAQAGQTSTVADGLFAEPGLTSDTDGSSTVLVVRGVVGMNGGTHPETVLLTAQGNFTTCRQWDVNGRSGGPTMSWEVHFLTTEPNRLQAAIRALDGLTSITVSPLATFDKPPSGPDVTAAPCR